MDRSMQDLTNFYWFMQNFSEIILDLVETGDFLKTLVVSDILLYGVEIEKLTINGQSGRDEILPYEKNNEALVILSKAIRVNTFLWTIEIKSVIGLNEGIYEIMTCLKGIKEINISHIGMDNEGAIALAKSLKNNNSLTLLNLERNMVGKEGVIALANSLRNNSALIHLNLDFNEIDNEGAIALAELLKNKLSLIKLSIWDNKIGNEGAIVLAGILKNHSSLSQLNLERNMIGEKGAIALAEFLKGHNSLTHFNIDNNEIGNEGVIPLAESLKNNISLTHLSLAKNEIGKEGAIALAEFLKNQNSVTQLKLGLNEISKEGAVALAKSLKRNNSLTQVTLEQNKIGKEGAIALAQSLSNNNSITLLDMGNNEIGQEGTIALAESLKNNSALTRLNFWNNETGKEGASALAKLLKNNKVLSHLRLDKNEIGNEGVIALAESLKNNNTLTHLRLDNNEIGKQGAIALAESLKINNSLIQLNLGCNMIDDGGVIPLAESLKYNNSLTHLSLDTNQIGNEGVIAFAEALRSNNSLTHLNLNTNKIGNEGVIELADSLKNNFSLTFLSLCENEIGNEGAIAISESLENNHSLTELKISYNQIDCKNLEIIYALLKKNIINQQEKYAEKTTAQIDIAYKDSMQTQFIKEKIKIEEAIKRKIIATCILDGMKGTITSITKKRVYKIESIKGYKYIIKVYEFNKNDMEKIKDAINEYELSAQLSSITPYVAKGIRIERIEKFHKIRIESLYEYGGKNLLALVNNEAISLKTIFEWIKQSIEGFAITEENGIFHSDIKPYNLVWRKIIKIIDFGCSQKLPKSQLMDSTEMIFKGATLSYLPPEILKNWGKFNENNNYKFNPIKVDVYCWGMTFYQIISGTKSKEMKEDIEKFKMGDEKEYEGFMEKVKNMKIKAAEAGDEALLVNIKKILLSALHFNQDHRLTFKMISKMISTIKLP